jgi:chromosome segregation ATPase
LVINIFYLADLDKLEDEKAEIAKKQLESEQKSSSLYFKITSFDSEMATIKSERAEENMKNSIIIQDLKSKVEELEQTVTLKNTQIDDLTRQLNGIKSNGSGLNHSSHYDEDTVKEKNLEIADLKNKVASLESIKAKEANDHSILRNNQQTTIDKLSSTNMEQFKQIETLRNRVGCLEKIVVDKEKQVSEYKSKVDLLNNQHIELKSQIDINQDHSSILPSMPSLITIHEALKSNGLDISEMQSENLSLKRVNQSLLSQKNSIVQVFNQALEDIYSIGPEYKERLQGFEGVYSKFVDISNQYQNIKNENFGLKIENSKLESSKKELDNTINSLYNRQSILIQILIQVASFQDVDNFDVSKYVTPEDFERIKQLSISSNLNFSSFQEFAKSFIKVADLLETKHKNWDQREEQILNSLKEIEPTLNGPLDQAVVTLKSQMDKAMLDLKLMSNELSNMESTVRRIKSDTSTIAANRVSESKYQSLVKKLEVLEKSYEEDKNKFKKQITLLKDAKLELECENSTFTTQIKSLKDEKERYKARAEEIQNKIFVFNKDTDSLVNDLKSFDVFGYKDQFKRLNSDIDKLREQLKFTTDQLNDYKKKSSEFENLYNNAQLSLDQERTLTKALKVYEDQFEAISAQIRQSEAEAIFKLKSEKQNLEAKINTLNNESAQNQKNFQAKISQLEQTINGDVLKFNELSNNLIECQAELKSAQAQVTELEGIKTSFEARIEALKNSKDLRTPAQVKQYVDSLKAEKKTVESQLKEVLDERDQKLKLIVSYETTIASLTSQITENKKEYDQSISERNNEISQIKSNLSNTQSMLDSEFSKSEKYKAQVEDYQSQIESLTQSQENFKTEIESIKEKYNSDRSELESNISLLEKQLDELNNSKNEELLNVLDWTQKISDAKAERDSLQGELERAKMQLKDTSSSLEDYKNEIKLVNSKFDSEISKLKAKNDELEFSNTTLRNQFVGASRAQLTPDLQRTDELNKDLISQIGHLKSQLSATELQIKLLNDQFKSKEAELSSVQAALEIEKQKLLSIQPSSTLIEKVNSLTQDSEIQKSEISQLKDQLREKETRSNDLIKQKDAIKSELDSLKDKSNNDTSAIKKLEQDVAVYKLQAENWMERYKASTQNQEAIDPDEFANLKCSNEALIKEKTDLQTRVNMLLNLKLVYTNLYFSFNNLLMELNLEMLRLKSLKHIN